MYGETLSQKDRVGRGGTDRQESSRAKSGSKQAGHRETRSLENTGPHAQRLSTPRKLPFWSSHRFASPYRPGNKTLGARQGTLVSLPRTPAWVTWKFLLTPTDSLQAFLGVLQAPSTQYWLGPLQHGLTWWSVPAQVTVTHSDWWSALAQATTK